MSLKRKIEKSNDNEIFENGAQLLENDKDFENDDDDSTDGELSDSNFEDDFEGITLASESDSEDEANENDNDEWEDVDSVDEYSSDEESDSDYVGSSKEETLEKETSKLDTKISQTKAKQNIKKSDSNISDLKNKLAVIPKQKNQILQRKKKLPLENGQASTSTKTKPTSNNSDPEQKPEENNEYAEDSSDEEDLRNTIGNIPINWYDDYEHLGYGLDSLPIYKPKKGDKLDQFLERLENPDYNRTVFDKQTGQNVRLSDAHLDLVNRLLTGRVPNPQHNMYEPFCDLFSHEVSEMPLSGRQEHKRSFLPNKAERQKVVRLAHLMKRGLYKKSHKPKKEEQKYYDIWKPRDRNELPLMRVHDPIPAPKMPLPTHHDSYNPPPEYLMKKTDELKLKGKVIEDRPLFKGFWRKFKSVREIPGYRKTIQERYGRLLDLYLAPRKKYTKIIAQSKDFLPKLPDKKDLRPYPTLEGLIFKGHRSIIRTISLHPGGKYLASGSDDHTIRIWEVSTGRCLRIFEVEEAVKKVSWNPNPKLFLLGVAMGKMIVFLNPESYLTDKLIVQQTNSIFKEEVEQGDYLAASRIEDAVKWRKPTEEEWRKGYRIVLDHFSEVKEIVWHRQGDYFASLLPEGNHRSVLVHQLSRWRSQTPFQRNKGRVQALAFHPKEPYLFITTQSHIRIYNLKRRALLKKVQANSRWVSCIAVHPGGEHFIIGGYDRRVNWFEMECTKRPHLMRYHSQAVRSINFHRKYPLFASCSDDMRVIVAHGMVYDDYLKDPLIVPLKQLKGHAVFDDYYVLDVAWHPFEPYLFTAGADATIRLWH